ncbi:hypothetical protein [Corynebacterium anserum]|nr:hypothetical protein [Corynebacterium anserum]
MTINPAGRRRKYCSHACRQRSYEQRHQLEGTGIPQDSVILSASKVAKLHDELFELRCAAEDIHTAAHDGEDHATIALLAADVVNIARQVENFRNH